MGMSDSMMGMGEAGVLVPLTAHGKSENTISSILEARCTRRDGCSDPSRWTSVATYNLLSKYYIVACVFVGAVRSPICISMHDDGHG